LAEAGVKVGLPRDVATLLAAQMMKGAASVVLETGDHPALLKDAVTTPAGCRIDGILELEEGKLRVTLIKAVVKATSRASELLFEKSVPRISRLVIPSEVEEPLDDMTMALLYLISGLVAGALLIAAVFLLVRRTNGVASDPQGELVRRLEIIDRSLRDEFSRNREEAGAASKNQREELARSLEGVRSIVDVRLRQLQDDNAKQIDKMRATVDEKLQGTLEKRL